MPTALQPGSPSWTERARALWPGWPESAYAHIFNIYQNGGYRQVFIGADGQARSMPPAGSQFPAAWSNISSGQPPYYPYPDQTFSHPGPTTYQPPTQQNWPTGGGTPRSDMEPTLGGFTNPFNPGTGPNYGVTDSGGSNPSSGGFDWKQLLLHGIPVIQGLLEARSAGRQAKNVQNASREQRAQTLALASPERYLQNYQGYLGAFKESYRPWLVGEQDRAAIGEQGAMQAFDTDVARRGLSGSGLALAGRSAIRTGRQAQIGENMRKYWSMTDEAARDAAGQTRSAELSASLGAPYQYIPRPSPTTAAVGGLGDAYRDWLWLSGTQNNPFVSKKDQPYR